MNKRRWVLIGHKRKTEFFHQMIPEDALSGLEMILLLQRLASRHLQPHEIVAASLAKTAAGYRSELEVRRSASGQFSLVTDTSIWKYEAKLVIYDHSKI